MGEMDNRSEAEITRLGNPGKPTGSEGAMMLDRMNVSHHGVTSWALDKLPADAPAPKILDIGCGGGNTLKILSQKYADASLLGMDYSEVSVEKSKEYNKEDVASGKMNIVHGSVEAMPFSDDSFDYITTVESFYFWPDSLENLKEVRRVLKKDGRFYLIADIYGKDDLPESVLENIERFQLTNPTVEEFIWLFSMAGFRKTKIHLKENTDWICVEGMK